MRAVTYLAIGPLLRYLLRHQRVLSASRMRVCLDQIGVTRISRVGRAGGRGRLPRGRDVSS